jgi:hypothetical protein
MISPQRRKMFNNKNQKQTMFSNIEVSQLKKQSVGYLKNSPESKDSIKNII